MAIGLLDNWLNKLTNVTKGFNNTGMQGTGTEADPLQMGEVSYTEKRNTMSNGSGILNASIWESLFGNADDIISAIKRDPNQPQGWYNNGAVVLPGTNTGINPIVIIGGVLLVVVIIVIAVMAGKK